METEAGQTGRVIFTMKWRQDDRWEGRDFEVRLDAVEDPAENQETAYALASSEGKNQV